MKKNFLSTLLQTYFWAAAAGALAALVLLLAQPSEAASAWIFGLSKPRAVLAVVLLLGIFAAVGIALLVRRSSLWSERILVWVRNCWLYWVSLIASLIGLFVGSQLWHLANIVVDPYVRGFLTRLVPLLLLLTTFSLQSLILLPILRHGWDDLRGAFTSKTLRLSGLIFALILLIWAVIALTGLGITPDAIGWDAPGVPLTVGLVGFVLLVALIGLLWPLWNLTPPWKNFIISILIWLAAVLIWQQVPTHADYFAPAPQPPNFEFYPHSDAAIHDIAAQRLLMGEGFDGVARKPLYSIFLAGLHWLAGEDYAKIALFQIMVIALLPVGLYWITKTLHVRVSGLIAAALFILRERNALMLSGTIGVSNVKLLMSDLPATLGMVLLTTLLVYWLRQPAQRRAAPLVIGGTLGLLLLIRPQIVVFVPAIFVLILIAAFRHSPFAIRFSLSTLYPPLIFTLGLTLTILPWLWRSYQLIGQFALNDPAQNAFLTQQYSPTPGESRIVRNSGESDAKFTQRVDAYLSEFVRANPGYVAGFITRHFAHNWVEALLALPLSPWLVQAAESDLFPYWRAQADDLWADCCSPEAYVGAQPFWDDWQGAFTTENTLMLALNLGLLALGLSVAFRRNQLIGWLPLGVALVYISSTAVGRYSGWRLLLPADWVLLLYLSIGLGQSVVWSRFYIQRRSDKLVRRPTSDVRRSSTFNFQLSTIFIGMFFLALGFTPLMLEAFIPRPASPFPADIRTTFELIPEIEPILPSVEALLADERSVLLEGRILYPRFYLPNEGEPGNEWTAFSPREYRRLGFVLLTASHANIVLPLDEAPVYFPHAADALVLGCRTPDYISARLVVLHDGGGYTTLRSSSELSCAGMP